MPAFSLEELEKLQKSSPKKKETSALAPIERPTSESLSKPAVSIAPARPTNSGLEQFEHSIGGRDALIDNLSLANLDKKQQHFLDLLCDPKRKRDTINTITRDAGLTPLQVIDLFRSSVFAKAHAVAMARMAAALPAVADDIAAKSVDAKVECPICFGAKEVNNAPCPQCFGKGEVLRFSDLDRQKILLESTGVTKKGSPGVNVQVNQQVGIASPGNFFSRYVKDSDSAAYDVIDITPDEKP